MSEQRKPTNEKLLFHGTTPDVVDAICTRNFDQRRGVHWRKEKLNVYKTSYIFNELMMEKVITSEA